MTYDNRIQAGLDKASFISHSQDHLNCRKRYPALAIHIASLVVRVRWFQPNQSINYQQWAHNSCNTWERLGVTWRWIDSQRETIFMTSASLNGTWYNITLSRNNCHRSWMYQLKYDKSCRVIGKLLQYLNNVRYVHKNRYYCIHLCFHNQISSRNVIFKTSLFGYVTGSSAASSSRSVKSK